MRLGVMHVPEKRVWSGRAHGDRFDAYTTEEEEGGETGRGGDPDKNVEALLWLNWRSEIDTDKKEIIRSANAKRPRVFRDKTD